MALYDTADLVDRFRKLVRRPSHDVALTITDIYRYLTDGQIYWLGQLQVHFPRMGWSEWEKLTPAGDNKSYTFQHTPLGPVEIYPSQQAPYRLRAGGPSDQSADFFWAGDTTIQIPGDSPRVFADGPYARYMPRPADIALGVDPVLMPLEARLLMVYQAAVDWAHEGNLENPANYEDMIDKLWLGKRPGDVGILGLLKQRYASSSHGTGGPWYKSPDLSNFPQPTS